VSRLDGLECELLLLMCEYETQSALNATYKSSQFLMSRKVTYP